jgi:hypothetical protein
VEKYSAVFISAVLKLTAENAEIKSPQKKPLIRYLLSVRVVRGHVVMVVDFKPLTPHRNGFKS